MYVFNTLKFNIVSSQDHVKVNECGNKIAYQDGATQKVIEIHNTESTPV